VRHIACSLSLVNLPVFFAHVLAPDPLDRYNPELTAQWTREIAGSTELASHMRLRTLRSPHLTMHVSLADADEIKNKLKSELELPRYKYVVQVLIGEQRGEGVRYVAPWRQQHLPYLT
jgi:hypothetical protein